MSVKINSATISQQCNKYDLTTVQCFLLKPIIMSAQFAIIEPPSVLVSWCGCQKVNIPKLGASNFNVLNHIQSIRGDRSFCFLSMYFSGPKWRLSIGRCRKGAGHPPDHLAQSGCNPDMK
jgi:hypothetical protein